MPLNYLGSRVVGHVLWRATMLIVSLFSASKRPLRLKSSSPGDSRSQILFSSRPPGAALLPAPCTSSPRYLMSVLRHPACVLFGPLMTMLWSPRPVPPCAIGPNVTGFMATITSVARLAPSAMAGVASVANRTHPRGRVCRTSNTSNINHHDHHNCHDQYHQPLHSQRHSTPIPGPSPTLYVLLTTPHLY